MVFLDVPLLLLPYSAQSPILFRGKDINVTVTLGITDSHEPKSWLLSDTDHDE